MRLFVTLSSLLIRASDAVSQIYFFSCFQGGDLYDVSVIDNGLVWVCQGLLEGGR